MDSTITTRLPEEIVKDVQFFAKIEHVDISTITRKMIAEAIQRKKLEYALDKYKRGEITIGKSAALVGKDIREMMIIASKRDIPFQYSKEDLREDFDSATKNDS